MRLSLLFPVLLLISIVSCKKPVDALNEGEWREYSHPAITKALLGDTIPGRLINELGAKELNGIKVTYTSGKVTKYFKYEANKEVVLSVLTRLPFKLTSHGVVDTSFQHLNISFSKSGKDLLSKEEVAAAEFFWSIDPTEFEYYECTKDSDKHTLLISKKTKTILHRIESV